MKSKEFPDYKDLPVVWRWLGRLVTACIVKRNRFRALRAEKRRIPVLEGTIATIKEQSLKVEKLGLTDASTVYNVCLYLLLVDRDFAIIKVDMVSTSETWRLKFTARQSALLLYEACDDLAQMLGKDFRKSLQSLEIDSKDMDKFNEVSKRLNKFRTDNHSFLYNDLRNLVAGHRTQKSLQFLQAIENLDSMRVFKLGVEFYEIVHQLNDFFIVVIPNIGKPEIAVKLLSRSKIYMASIKK